MGGFGSGRWGYSKADAKDLVEHCWVLDVQDLVRAQAIRPGLCIRGGLSWKKPWGEVVASIGYMVAATSESGTVRLSYGIGRSEPREELQYEVPLATTRLPSGGRRWWFICTARRRGGPACSSRVAKLYLPPGGRVFACRSCHELTYRSSRESRKGDKQCRALARATGLPLELIRIGMELDRLESQWARRRG